MRRNALKIVKWSDTTAMGGPLSTIDRILFVLAFDLSVVQSQCWSPMYSLLQSGGTVLAWDLQTSAEPVVLLF